MIEIIKGEIAMGESCWAIAYLRELNLASVILRLTMAMVFGGVIGLERARKQL